MERDYQGIAGEWYTGIYSPEAYARIIEERHKGLRLSRVTTAGNLCQYIAHISGGRIPMINNQTAQHLPLLNPKPPQQMAGVEADWAKTVLDARIDATSEVVVLKRLPKYKIVPGVVSTCNTHYVIWRDMQTHEIGITEVPHHMGNHAFSTSILKPTPVYANMSEGDILHADEVLAHGSSRTAHGNYAYGIDLNWCWLGRYSTNEDAIEMSRRGTELTKHVKLDTVSFWLYGDDVLLNMHGSENDVRPLPTVGDVIGETGIVAALRKNTRVFSLVNNRKDNLRKANRPFDKAFTSIAGSRVIEVKVLRHGRGDFKYLTTPVTRYMDLLAESGLAMWREILEIDASERRMAGPQYPRHLSWHTMVVQAEQELMAAGIKSPTVAHKVPTNLRGRETIPASKPTIGDKPYTYYVQITLAKVHTPTLGDKYTNRHGSKAVIGKITENEDMPTDKWGRFADVIANPAGVSNRNNPGQVNEAYANDACFHGYNRLLELTTLEEQWDFLFGLYQTLSIETAHTVSMFCTTLEEKQAHIEAIIANGRIDIINEAGDPTLGVHGTDLLMASTYRPPMGKLWVTNLDGTKHLTLPTVRIAPLYTFALDKIGRYASATNVASRQSMGFVAKASARDKDLTHISQTSNRHLGYTEVRSLAANSNPEDAAYVLKTNNSHKAMEIRTRRQLDGVMLGEPLETHEISSGRGLELFNHELQCFGSKLSVGEDKDE